MFRIDTDKEGWRTIVVDIGDVRDADETGILNRVKPEIRIHNSSEQSSAILSYDVDFGHVKVVVDKADRETRGGMQRDADAPHVALGRYPGDGADRRHIIRHLQRDSMPLVQAPETEVWRPTKWEGSKTKFPRKLRSTKFVVPWHILLLDLKLDCPTRVKNTSMEVAVIRTSHTTFGQISQKLLDWFQIFLDTR